MNNVIVKDIKVIGFMFVKAWFFPKFATKACKICKSLQTAEEAFLGRVVLVFTLPDQVEMNKTRRNQFLQLFDILKKKNISTFVS